jgi:hypothetical protein
VIEGVTREVVARELDGEERDRHYERGIEIYPGWTEYRKRAAHRRIPVLELTTQVTSYGGSSIEPSSRIVQRGLWAISQAWPSGSSIAAE